MISKIMSVVSLVVVIFGMSLLFITGGGIVMGLTKKHIIEPMHQRYWVEPTYVDDPRCCR